VLVTSDTNYTTASLASLAKSLAGATPLGGPQAPPARPAPPFGSASGGTRPGVVSLEASSALSCLVQAGGIAGRAGFVPAYLEAGFYRTRPAYIGAFRHATAGGRVYLLVLAALRGGCDHPLAVITEAAP
jgi:hypothetical protein